MQDKVYVELKSDGLPIDKNIQAAIDGFSALNYQIIPYTFDDILSDKFWRISKDSVFVGSIRAMRYHWSNLKIQLDNIDYPEQIKYALGRRIKKVSMEKALLSKQKIFIKPVKSKLFDGSVYDGTPARRSYFEGYKDADVWISEVIENIQSEWRFFIHKNELIHASCYGGNVIFTPDWNFIDDMMVDWKSPPVAYTLDVAVNHLEKCSLMEVNDFYAIGSYSLESTTYAEMLRDRYFEIVKNAP